MWAYFPHASVYRSVCMSARPALSHLLCAQHMHILCTGNWVIEVWSSLELPVLQYKVFTSTQYSDTLPNERQTSCLCHLCDNFYLSFMEPQRTMTMLNPCQNHICKWHSIRIGYFPKLSLRDMFTSVLWWSQWMINKPDFNSSLSVIQHSLFTEMIIYPTTLLLLLPQAGIALCNTSTVSV